jgi:hypothetical protein
MHNIYSFVCTQFFILNSVKGFYDRKNTDLADNEMYSIILCSSEPFLIIMVFLHTCYYATTRYEFKYDYSSGALGWKSTVFVC